MAALSILGLVVLVGLAVVAVLVVALGRARKAIEQMKFGSERQ